MKNIRHLCAVGALACVFAISAYAGEISCGVADPPPPPPPQQAATVDAADETDDGVLQIAVTLLQGMLSVF